MSNELNHSGIKGQKWGIRRYQNEDRTWTAEGKIRYGRKSREREPTHDELMKSTNAKEIYKYRDRLSDQELQNRINRINMERNLRNLRGDNVYKKGMKAAKAAVATVGTVGAVISSVKTVKKWGVNVTSAVSLLNSFANMSTDEIAQWMFE